MLVTVIVINVSITICCFFLAQKVWRLRQTLNRVTRVLIRLDCRIEQILRRTTELLNTGQQGSQRLTQQYRVLDQQIKRIRKVMALFSLSQTLVWFWLNQRKPQN